MADLSPVHPLNPASKPRARLDHGGQRRQLRTSVCLLATLLLTALWQHSALAAIRARELGVPFEGESGRWNAITDVAGIEVGQVTLVEGDGPLVPGRGPVRTGVTVIHPLGKHARRAVAAGRAVVNGTGEWTGLNMVDEVGLFFGPVVMTGTGGLATAQSAVVHWSIRRRDLPAREWFTRLLPVVGETLDIRLNDVFGEHLREEHVFRALDTAASGPVAEGNVGGGTGMVAYEFKGGIGTASRVIDLGGRRVTVGVLLQANHGRRTDLRIAGIPIGHEIPDLMPVEGAAGAADPDQAEKNSLLVVVATDAPMLPHQLQRLARRAALGLGRTGSTAGNFSGEFVLAFSTTSTFGLDAEPLVSATVIPDTASEALDALFRATVQATEEAIVNQLVASTTMTGINGNTVHGLPHDRLVQILGAHGMLTGAARR